MLTTEDGWKFLATDKKSKGIVLATRVVGEQSEAGVIEHAGRTVHAVAVQWVGAGDMNVNLSAEVDAGEIESFDSTQESGEAVKLAYGHQGGPDTWPILVGVLSGDVEDEPLRKTRWLYHPDAECAPGNTHLIRVSAEFRPVARGTIKVDRTLQLIVECVDGHHVPATSAVD